MKGLYYTYCITQTAWKIKHQFVSHLNTEINSSWFTGIIGAFVQHIPIILHIFCALLCFVVVRINRFTHTLQDSFTATERTIKCQWSNPEVYESINQIILLKTITQTQLNKAQPHIQGNNELISLSLYIYIHICTISYCQVTFNSLHPASFWGNIIYLHCWTLK